MSDPAIAQLVPVEGLRGFLDERIGPSGAPIEVTRLGEGQSNLTFLVRRGDDTFVLRRPPRGVIRPGTRQMDREFKVMSAIERVGRPVPVPHQIALCEDASVLGVPFYLMGYVDGIVIRGGIPEPLAAQRREVGWELIDTLAKIHTVDWRAAGLQDMAKEPERFVARNLERMQQLYEVDKTRDLAEIEEAGSWLRANLPSRRDISLTHGDYKLDNVMYARDLPARIVAVVDWEISTIGDPMVDFGWLLYFTYEPGEGGGLGGASADDGYPSRAEMVERYARTSGVEPHDIPFYAAMAGWKIAIIMEGSYRRFQSGQADHPMFASLDAGVKGLANRALQIIHGELTVV